MTDGLAMAGPAEDKEDCAGLRPDATEGNPGERLLAAALGTSEAADEGVLEIAAEAAEMDAELCTSEVATAPETEAEPLGTVDPVGRLPTDKASVADALLAAVEVDDEAAASEPMGPLQSLLKHFFNAVLF